MLSIWQTDRQTDICHHHNQFELPVFDLLSSRGETDWTSLTLSPQYHKVDLFFPMAFHLFPGCIDAPLNVFQADTSHDADTPTNHSVVRQKQLHNAEEEAKQGVRGGGGKTAPCSFKGEKCATRTLWSSLPSLHTHTHSFQGKLSSRAPAGPRATGRARRPTRPRARQQADASGAAGGRRAGGCLGGLAHRLPAVRKEGRKEGGDRGELPRERSDSKRPGRIRFGGAEEPLAGCWAPIWTGRDETNFCDPAHFSTASPNTEEREREGFLRRASSQPTRLTSVANHRRSCAWLRNQ